MAPRKRGRAALAQRLLGLVFLGTLAGLVALTVGLYQKAFTPVVLVRLDADRIGNQLSRGADVKVRGLLVGQVRSVRSTGDGAHLELALDPGRARDLPADLHAQLLPKTLFGEKYVDLQPDLHGTGRRLRAGDVITQDRTSTGLETETALNDLLPLLQSLRPAELSMTLSALSGALRGRGDEVGVNLARTGAYLARLNPSLPTLQADFDRLASVTRGYADATPDLLRVLDNLSFSSRSLVDQQRPLAAFLRSSTVFSASADRILRQNQTRLVRLAADSLPSLSLYARYAPEYPCLLSSVAAQDKPISDSFGGLQPGLHITLEVTRDHGGYTPDQTPVYGERKGPSCYGLDPKHPIVPMTDYENPVDGYFDGQPTDPSTGRPPCSCASFGPVKLAAAPVLGVAPADVPDVAALLLAPVASGATLGLA